MLDNEFHISTDIKATLVSLICHNFKEHQNELSTKRSLNELRELLRTLGVEAGGEYIQNRKSIDPSTILGSGKLIEIANQAKEDGSQLLVFDFDLTAGQIKNIKKITKLSVVDRCHVILEIFAKHARTKEAKIQIEIARLQYILPRLSGFWTHLGRQKGGIGVKGGEGEQQIELDRRIIRDRIKFFKKELKQVVVSRNEQKKLRNNKAITAALVGYTNAGKSSLMNRLCNVNILEEDMLFATLDSTYRTLNPNTKPPMIMIDTVGFISNLPNTLIDGFKTTLESALEADLLVVVCDISDPNFKKQLEVTNEVLNDLNLSDKKQIIIFNKKDKLPNIFEQKIILRQYKDSFLVSTFDKIDMENLKKYILDYFLSQQEQIDLFVPYSHGRIHSIISSKTNIMTKKNHEKGTFYRIRIPEFILKNLGINKFILKPNQSKKYLTSVKNQTY